MQITTPSSTPISAAYPTPPAAGDPPATIQPEPTDSVSISQAAIQAENASLREPTEKVVSSKPTPYP